ncbi:hypothetical protein ACFWIW_10840 [Amycolatopsis sp. NPDC058340]|uniref:hypothetical protein n=1 Tax=Amycolatopsis sp. NPDC058340 TaxID=3346453 RepID=UPI0036528D29
MSSMYRILCLSHDPAIVIEHPEFHSGSNGRELAEAVVLRGIEGHKGCDLLIGRYSYPLIEVGCPDRTREHVGGYHPHHTVWVDAIWLKLLYLAQRAPKDSPERQLAERAPMPGCWTPERLHCLRTELDLAEGTTQ